MMAVRGRQLSEAEAIETARLVAESERRISVSRRQEALLAAAAMDGQKRWAILKVEPRHDNDVDKSLAKALIDHWLPLCKADENDGGRRRGAPGQPVWVLAWPGYVFVRVVDTAAAWAGLRTIKHVKSVLGVGESPFFVSDAMMLRIKAELATRKALKAGTGLLVAPGDLVRIKDGPFASWNAGVIEVCEGKDEGRAVVEIMLFGSTRPVMLDLAQLEK